MRTLDALHQMGYEGLAGAVIKQAVDDSPSYLVSKVRTEFDSISWLGSPSGRAWCSLVELDAGYLIGKL